MTLNAWSGLPDPNISVKTSTEQERVQELAEKYGTTSYRNRADTQNPAYGFTAAQLTALIAEVKHTARSSVVNPKDVLWMHADSYHAMVEAPLTKKTQWSGYRLSEWDDKKDYVPLAVVVNPVDPATVTEANTSTAATTFNKGVVGIKQDRKPGEYIGKMLIQCGSTDRVVTSIAWLNDDGMISRLVKQDFNDRDVFIVDRFHDDNFPKDWGTRKYTIDEMLSWIQPARITVDKPIPEIAQKYPKYYKDVRDIDFMDVYSVHQVFGVSDPSGAIHHASKKLLLSGVRTGGKSIRSDIKEARDTLTRYLELHPEG